MANLQITTYRDATVVPLGDPISEEVVVIGSGSLTSAILTGSKINYKVRLFAEADCFVTWGVNPTALIDGTEGRMLGSGNPEYFSIPAGNKIAVIERV